MPVLDHYAVKFRRTGPSLSESDVSACESHLGVSFPAPYSRFLLEYNGGSPSPAYLPFPGCGAKVKRFFSIADNDLVDKCEQDRRDHSLPNQFVPIAELGETDSFLVLDCSAASAGTLLTWCELDEGFRYRDAEYSNASELYYSIDQLFLKFGPAKNREDRDGMFCRFYYSSAAPQHGPKLATAFVKVGYDINFVLPTFRHPIFGAIDSEAFGVAATLLELGTATDHLDPLHGNASIAERLTDAFDKWHGLLEVTIQNKYAAGQSIAERRIAGIESSLQALQQATKKGQ